MDDVFDLLRAPYFVGLLFAFGFLGWLAAGTFGILAGAPVGALIGLFFDFTEHPWVERWRLAVTIAMIVVLAAGFYGWGT